jgi:septum formation protein
MTPFIYLASQSPRRRQLLEQISVPYQVLLANTGEDTESLEQELLGELPTHYVVRVTLAKLQAAVARHRQRGLPEAPILCADTTVALGNCILGKPSDESDAHRILSLLSGTTHSVLTAVALAWEERTAYALSTSQVQFANLSEPQIRRYIDSQEPFGKAGAYAIQSFAASWTVRIEGSYSAIMGLPLFETCELLKQAHVLPK